MLLKEVRYAVIDPDAIVELENIIPFIFEHRVLDLFAHPTKLPGTPVVDSLEQVGLHHHHYPCQASMGIDPLYGDTLMHVSGNIMKDALKEALGEYLEDRSPVPRPHQRCKRRLLQAKIVCSDGPWRA